MEFRFDLVWAEVDQMPLPVPTNRAVLASHGAKQDLAHVVDLPVWDRLERATWLDLGRDIDEPFARSFLQICTDECRQRFLASRKHEQSGMRRLPQAAGRGRTRAFGAAGNLVDNRLRRARIGERNFVERQSQVGPGDGKSVKARFGTGPRRTETVIGSFVRPPINRLADVRYHRLPNR